MINDFTYFTEQSGSVFAARLPFWITLEAAFLLSKIYIMLFTIKGSLIAVPAHYSMAVDRRA